MANRHMNSHQAPVPHTSPRSQDQMTQESKEHEVVDFDPFVNEDQGPLPEIPARDGYAQRWVRVAIGNQPDLRNISTAERRGWKPRPIDTVHKSLRFMKADLSEFGGVIGTHSCVLMERPKAINDKVAMYERKKVKDLNVAVKNMIGRDYQNMGGSRSGFTAPSADYENRVTRGKLRVQDDD